MALLTDSDREKVRAELAAVTSPVRLVFFTQAFGCEMCPQTRRILDEVAALSDRITIEERNLILDKDAAATYGVDKAPAIAVVGPEDYGIRFFGVPAGYEFRTLIDAILMVSKGESGLSEESRALIAAVERPIAIQVFVTPT